MGVPTFYRWLCSRYPRVVKDVYDKINEKSVDFSNIEAVGVDLLSPNPNGEFDNLYLDMNGIIHPCCHPEGMEQPETEELMYKCIFDYIDRIFYLVRPRRLIFLAIDGVAPRAKMNQQRSRRFKSAAEAELDQETFEKVAQEFRGKNLAIPERKEKWDSNVITPGTLFMYELSKRLVDYIKKRRSLYEAWKRITIIFSDANVPGEGEHKIMEFIRNQRHSPHHNPNYRHVLHGMDADLIMLGLATHEVNFYIIREVVTDFAQKRSEDTMRNEMLQAVQRKESNLQSDNSYRSKLRQAWKPMQFLQLSVLREYLTHQLYFPHGWRISSRHRCIDFERCVDDLVLLCFFCGNDFLPHLPSISISSGSIDQMIFLYQQILPDLGDYLCDEGYLNLKQLDIFVEYLALVEHDVFSHVQQRKATMKRRRLESQQQQQQQTNENGIGNHSNSNSSLSSANGNGATKTAELHPLDEFKRRQQELLKEHNQVDDPKEPIDLSLEDPRAYKAAYYREKFELQDADDNAVREFAAQVANDYVTGMAWVLAYYYQGCPSWCWYYPYHYAPFCSDLRFEDSKIHFDYGSPFTPYQQLLSVMPARSSHCLPDGLRFLMHDPDSPLIHFYPKKFKEDPNGMRYRYQWVALLPFIDQDLLLSTVVPLEAKLPQEEKHRNSRGKDYLLAPGSRQLERLVGEKIKLNDHHEFSSISDKRHRCALLPGAIVPPPILRLEDVMDDSRNRGFNCDVAKRFISNALGNNSNNNYDNYNRGPLAPNKRDYHQYNNAYNPMEPRHDQRDIPYGNYGNGYNRGQYSRPQVQQQQQHHQYHHHHQHQHQHQHPYEAPPPPPPPPPPPSPPSIHYVSPHGYQRHHQQQYYQDNRYKRSRTND